MNRLERLEALAEKATPRPWTEKIGVYGDHEHGYEPEFEGIVASGVPGQPWVVRFDDDYGTDQVADAALILAAADALPDLLAAVRAAYGIAANARPIRESSLTQLAQGDTGKTIGWVVDCEPIEANRTALEPLYREDEP